PANFSAYFSRALVNFYFGALPQSLADFNRASELDPKNAYVALWLDIAGKRSKLPSRLAEATEQINMTTRPAPIVRLYLNQTTVEAVISAAVDPDANTKNSRLCDVGFYSGELALQRGAKDEAVRLFRTAAAHCPKHITPWWTANAELNALGQ